MRRGNLFFAAASAILTMVFIAIAFAVALGQEWCSNHPRPEIITFDEILNIPCIQFYRTIYPSDMLASSALGVSVRNFHCWEYDLDHVSYIPPAYTMPAIHDFEKGLPPFPGEEADRVPELKEGGCK